MAKSGLLFSHQDTKTQIEYGYKLNKGVFSLISICHALMRLRRIKNAITVHGFKGSGFNENMKCTTSKVNEKKVTRLG